MPAVLATVPQDDTEKGKAEVTSDGVPWDAETSVTTVFEPYGNIHGMLRICVSSFSSFRDMKQRNPTWRHHLAFSLVYFTNHLGLRPQKACPQCRLFLTPINPWRSSQICSYVYLTTEILPLWRAAGIMNKKRRVERDPLPVIAMLDTCFNLAARVVLHLATTGFT